MRKMLTLGICLLLVSVGCVASTSAEDVETRASKESEMRSAIMDFNGVFGEYIDALETQQEAIYDLVGIISDDFSDNLWYPEDLDDDKVMEFYDRFIELYPDILGAFLRGYEFIEKWNEMEEVMLPETRTSDHNYGEDTRFLLTAGVLVVGLGMMAYSGYKAVKGAFNKNADLSKKIVEDASSADLKKINEELGLPPDSSKEEIAEHIDGLSLSEKNIAARKIQELDFTVSLESSPTHATEIRQTHAEIARDVGKEGVKIYASAITTVTGGQGVDKIASALGASEGAAAAVDVVLTVSEKQPLDFLARDVETGMTSSSKEVVTVETPEVEKSVSSAKSVLKKAIEGEEVTQEDLENSADSLAKTVAEKNKEDLKTGEDWNGDLSVELPQKAAVQHVEEVEDGDELTVPNLGTSNLVVTSPETVPETHRNIDLYDEEPEIEVDFEDVDDLSFTPSDTPIDIVFCIDVTGSMSDDIAEVVASTTDILITTSMMTTNFQFGFVCFRDIEEDMVPFERFAFSSDIGEIQSNINVLPGMVYGGGDIPESVYEGLAIAGNMPFRSEAEHSVILMGDAPAKTSYGGSDTRGTSIDNLTESEIDDLRSDPPDLESITDLARENVFSIHTIVIANSGYVDTEAQSDFQDIADATGGKRFDAEDASSVPDVILDVISTAIDEASEDDDEEPDDGASDGEEGGTDDEGSSSNSFSLVILFLVIVLVVVILLVVLFVVKKKEGPPSGASEAPPSGIDGMDKAEEDVPSWDDAEVKPVGEEDGWGDEDSKGSGGDGWDDEDAQGPSAGDVEVDGWGDVGAQGKSVEEKSDIERDEEETSRNEEESSGKESEGPMDDVDEKVVELGLTDCPKCKGKVKVPRNEAEYPFNAICMDCGSKGRIRKMPKNIEKISEQEDLEDW